MGFVNLPSRSSTISPRSVLVGDRDEWVSATLFPPSVAAPAVTIVLPLPVLPTLARLSAAGEPEDPPSLMPPTTDGVNLTRRCSWSSNSPPTWYVRSIGIGAVRFSGERENPALTLAEGDDAAEVAVEGGSGTCNASREEWLLNRERCSERGGVSATIAQHTKEE